MKPEKIDICTTCRKEILGYYFCPECGQESTTITKEKEYPIAQWIPHDERKLNETR